MNILNFQYKCVDALNFMKEIPDNTVKLIITSPPYNIGKEYEVKTNINTYLENMKPMIREMVRILAEDGSICWQTGNYADSSFCSST